MVSRSTTLTGRIVSGEAATKQGLGQSTHPPDPKRISQMQLLHYKKENLCPIYLFWTVPLGASGKALSLPVHEDPYHSCLERTCSAIGQHECCSHIFGISWTLAKSNKINKEHVNFKEKRAWDRKGKGINKKKSNLNQCQQREFRADRWGDICAAPQVPADVIIFQKLKVWE